jgi:hypothetical protein
MLKVENVPIKSVKQHPKNVRLHDERNLEAIMRSLKEFGQLKPIVVGQNNYVLAGNGTLESALRLGWKEINIVRVKLKTPDELAFMIADNKTTDLSEFDWHSLAEVMKELPENRLDATGFQAFEREPLLQADWNPGDAGSLDSGESSDDLLLRFTGEEAAFIRKELGARRKEGYSDEDMILLIVAETEVTA